MINYLSWQFIYGTLQIFGRWCNDNILFIASYLVANYVTYNGLVKGSCVNKFYVKKLSKRYATCWITARLKKGWFIPDNTAVFVSLQKKMKCPNCKKIHHTSDLWQPQHCINTCIIASTQLVSSGRLHYYMTGMSNVMLLQADQSQTGCIPKICPFTVHWKCILIQQ